MIEAKIGVMSTKQQKLNRLFKLKPECNLPIFRSFFLFFFAKYSPCLHQLQYQEGGVVVEADGQQTQDVVVLEVPHQLSLLQELLFLRVIRTFSKCLDSNFCGLSILEVKLLNIALVNLEDRTKDIMLN